MTKGQLLDNKSGVNNCGCYPQLLKRLSIDLSTRDEDYFFVLLLKKHYCVGLSFYKETKSRVSVF